MFTDIAGYIAQISKDEAVAISLLNKKESVLKSKFLSYPFPKAIVEEWEEVTTRKN